MLGTISSPSDIFLLAFKNIKIKMHKTVMLHVLCLKHGPNIKGRTWNVS